MIKKKKTKIRRQMLMNYYDQSTYEICKNTSVEAAFRWLAEANLFLYKNLPRKIWELRMEARDRGW